MGAPLLLLFEKAGFFRGMSRKSESFEPKWESFFPQRSASPRDTKKASGATGHWASKRQCQTKFMRRVLNVHHKTFVTRKPKSMTDVSMYLHCFVFFFVKCHSNTFLSPCVTICPITSWKNRSGHFQKRPEHDLHSRHRRRDRLLRGPVLRLVPDVGPDDEVVVGVPVHLVHVEALGTILFGLPVVAGAPAVADDFCVPVKRPRTVLKRDWTGGGRKERRRE